VQSITEAGVGLPWQDTSQLLSLLCEYHSVFALEDGERGEAGVVQMKIKMSLLLQIVHGLAHAVFQCLMQKVLMGLNPEEGHDFVSVYFDDILILSDTFEPPQPNIATVSNGRIKTNNDSKLHFGDFS